MSSILKVFSKNKQPKPTFHPDLKVWYTFSEFQSLCAKGGSEIPMIMGTISEFQDRKYGWCYSFSVESESFNQARENISKCLKQPWMPYEEFKKRNGV